jgi:hypothetical protein
VHLIRRTGLLRGWGVAVQGSELYNRVAVSAQLYGCNHNTNALSGMYLLSITNKPHVNSWGRAEM